MKIAFFGTPDFTVDFLSKLNETGFTPSLIVTNPDRPSGRGMNLKSPLPKIWANEHGIKVLQPEKIDQDFIDNLGDWDLFIVVAYGKILPESLIHLPKHGTINVHYSLLPKYRGATPVESAILNGDTTTGIAIQKMQYKLDTGPIYVRSEIDIEPGDTTPNLREKLNAEALRLLVPTISSIFKSSVIPIEQSIEGVSNCTKIKKEDGQLSLSEKSKINDRKYRAYYGSIGTYFIRDNKRIKITKAHLDGDQFVIDEVIPENGKRVTYNKI
jgi:methionyl-tRNA formyltransferase